MSFVLVGLCLMSVVSTSDRTNGFFDALQQQTDEYFNKTTAH